MVRSLLIRGMLVGLLAGVVAFVFAYFVGEPQVQAAIDYEELHAARSGLAADPELVSRGVQRTVGLATGTIALGIGLGGLFSLFYAFAYGRIAVVGARATAAAMALAAFITVTLVPFTKYPANPPAVGNPNTLDRRTLLFVGMIVISVLAAVAAGRIRRQVLVRAGAWNAAIIGGLVFVAVIAIAQLILPPMSEVPTGFPADVLYRFRLASLGTNATLWLTIGLAFGAAAERLLLSATSVNDQATA